MGLLDHLEKLINEHGSAAILREHLALVKAEHAALERKNKDFSAENESLKSVVEKQKIEINVLQEKLQKLQSGLVCDHCGSSNIKRTGSRPAPTFGKLGIKEAVFNCLDCGKETAVMQR